jgi:hypothetical protein
MPASTRIGTGVLTTALVASARSVGLGLDRDDLGHLAGVVGEVQAVAGAELEHRSGESVQQPTAMIGAAAALGGPGRALVHAGEERARDIACDGHAQTFCGCGTAAARAAMPSTIIASALENRSGGTACGSWSMWREIDHPVGDDHVNRRVPNRQGHDQRFVQLDVSEAHARSAGERLLEHRHGHVDPDHGAVWTGHLRTDQQIGPGPTPKIEDNLTGLDPSEHPVVGDPREALDARVRDAGQLRLRTAELLPPGAAGRKDELLLLLGGDLGVGLTNLAPQDVDVKEAPSSEMR